MQRGTTGQKDFKTEKDTTKNDNLKEIPNILLFLVTFKFSKTVSIIESHGKLHNPLFLFKMSCFTCTCISEIQRAEGCL